MNHREPHGTFPDIQRLAIAFMLSALSLALAPPVMSQEGGQAEQQQGAATQQQGRDMGMGDPYQGMRDAPPFPPRTSLFGRDSRYYGASDYDLLRPYGPRYEDPRGRHMMMPPTWPQTDIYGRHSGMYGGSDYDILRPRGPWHGQPPMNWQMPPRPRTDIFGRDSRMYGGPNYDLLR